VRLDRLKQEYGDQIKLDWIGYPLVHQPEAPRYFTDHHREEWAKANQEEPDLVLSNWLDTVPLPYSSLPALVVAHSAVRQGESVFKVIHDRIFYAYYTERRDISQNAVLIDLVQTAGLDRTAFEVDMASPDCWNHVLTGYQVARKESMAGIPTVKVGDESGSLKVVGEIDDRKYRKLIDWFLLS
jgi:predicted DsbA family dithiol-disulfide isomerase